MNLMQLITEMERIARQQPAIKSIVRNDVFRLNATPGTKYGVFAWTQGNHSTNPDKDTITYTFSLFYVDRLLNDRSNELEIQSTGIEVLHNILLTLSQEMEVSDESFTTFNQRFADECAGVFCNVSLTVLAGSACFDDYEIDTNIYLTTILGEYLTTIDNKRLTVLAEN